MVYGCVLLDRGKWVVCLPRRSACRQARRAEAGGGGATGFSQTARDDVQSSREYEECSRPRQRRPSDPVANCQPREPTIMTARNKLTY